MKQHKWHKEIKAWADGGEVEILYTEGAGSKSDWMIVDSHVDWDFKNCEYRIKPQPKEPTHVVQFTDEQLEQIQKAIKYASDNPITQPKEPQYLYVYKEYGQVNEFRTTKIEEPNGIEYIGKIKLETE